MDKNNYKVKSHTDDQGGGNGKEAQGGIIVDPQPNSITSLVIIIVLLLLLIPVAIFIQGDRPRLYWARDFLVVDQLILTGTETELEATIDQLDLGRFVERQDDVQFRDDLLQQSSCADLNQRYGGQDGDVIALYKITRRLTNAVEIIEQIQEGQQVSGSEAVRSDTVRAEPNWISGQPWEIEGSPWEIEGSPWEIEGSPWEIEGSSENTNVDSTEDMAADDFVNQLAMASISLPQARAFEFELEDAAVQVGVFDTSPFTTAVGTRVKLPVSWVSRPWELKLIRNPVVEAGPKPAINFNDHGLFVAGLVHAVAPNSDIELIRVLDGNNKGSLYDLMAALNHFIERVVDEDAAAVINLSLAIRLIPDEAEGFEELSRELGALADVLALARCSGIVVVAAAGNGSANAESPLDAYYPAAWPEVIGVAASNKDNERSCYSNRGDVGAPGGDGHAKKMDCRPLHYTCVDAQCKHAVLGPVLQPESADTGYAYWVGSSFATPLVSGLAARILDEGGATSPDTVREIIECSARGSSSDSDLGAGVINVPEALNNCLYEYAEAFTE